MLIGQQMGPFVIETELGSGAMGTVYRARYQKDEATVVPVALKMVALGLLGNEGAMARFDREASILKQLRHPNIVRLYATGHYKKTPFIAMELIDGEALDRALARRGRLSWEEVAAHGKQLADALQYAHMKGIIHRDLKPSNLMVTREGVLKLTDFGIAKDTDGTALTGMNSTIGTAAYMSPEQYKGEKNLTHKSDLYSLGICFFELLTGKKPFYADNTVDMFLKHVNERPPRIDKLVPNLPPKLAALILQLLEKDKDDRPMDAAWVGRMLGEIEEDAIARKSAGVEAANARRIDRLNKPGSSGSGLPAIDDADREAARALRTDKKKKKKKKANTLPFLQKTWVKATGLLLALATLGVVAFLMTRPASADTLFARVKAADSPEKKLEAATEYLEKYGQKPPDNKTEQRDEVATIFRDETVRQLDKQLANRFAKEKLRGNAEGFDPAAYAAAMEAIQAEKDGNLTAAERHWRTIATQFAEQGQLPYATDPDRLAKAKWGWLAGRRLADLNDVKGLLKQLQTDAEGYAKFPDWKPKVEPGSPEAKALRAVRLERFGDPEKAAAVWADVAGETQSQADQRIPNLLATQQSAEFARRGVKPPSPSRLSWLTAKLEAARQELKQAEAKPNEKAPHINAARILARDITDLYGDEKGPEAKVVEDASKLTIPKG